MATKQENRRTDVIRCEYCGEDYSVTYKRCPFCDDKAGYGGYSSGDRAPGRGGKRVATNKRGGGYGGGMQPVQIIGLALSIILIIAAIYIVFTVLSPLLGRGEPAGSESQPESSVSQSDVNVSQSDVSVSQSGESSSQPDVSTSGDISVPVVPDPSVSSGVITPIVTATGITLNTEDVTLKPDETHRITATLIPADCTDTVVWSSSNEAALTVAQDGTVTNVNKGASQANVTVTAQVGDIKATCIVRCKGGSTGSAGGTTTGSTTGTGTTTTAPVATGTTGTVTGTSTGLLIRSGPGRSYEAQDTAPNGTSVTILEQTGDGWYKINYSGDGGRTKTGYVSKDYIKVN